jgi:hypothetical protein
MAERDAGGFQALGAFDDERADGGARHGQAVPGRMSVGPTRSSM